ncbi:MAG: DUF5309 domain-containing protein, partial [Halieaceae bacterium]|nr:DUF5309 domain-containing protein [Halieaceae bacterium]
MSTTNTDAYDLKIAAADGVIHEDVMSKIWDISQIPLPFTDMIGSGSHDNQYFSWRADKLKDQVFDNAAVDGAAASGVNDADTGFRIGNHSQISTKEVSVSTRAQEVNTIGYANKLAYAVTKSQKQLRRDVEGMALLNQASVEGTSSVAGRAGGYYAWMTNDSIDGTTTTGNVSRASDGADGGWNASTKLVDAATPGTPEALTETKSRDVVENVYNQGGNVDTAMSTPAVKRAFSEYLFTSSARIASLIADGGGAASERQGSGSVDVFLIYFGSLKFVLYCLQPSFGADLAVHDIDAMLMIDS